MSEYILRPWRVDDAPAFRDAVDESLDRLKLWMNWAFEEPQTLEQTRDRMDEYARTFESGPSRRYAIIEADTQRLLGGVSLHDRVGPGGREIGYWLRNSATDRGVMSASVCKLTEFALQDLALDYVEIHCNRGNLRSEAVAKRLGFRCAGEEPYMRVDGEKRISDIYKLTRAEFPTSQMKALRLPAVRMQ